MGTGNTVLDQYIESRAKELVRNKEILNSVEESVEKLATLTRSPDDVLLRELRSELHDLVAAQPSDEEESIAKTSRELEQLPTSAPEAKREELQNLLIAFYQLTARRDHNWLDRLLLLADRTRNAISKARLKDRDA